MVMSGWCTMAGVAPNRLTVDGSRGERLRLASAEAQDPPQPAREAQGADGLAAGAIGPK
jgi:hypothetical protein